MNRCTEGGVSGDTKPLGGDSVALIRYEVYKLTGVANTTDHFLSTYNVHVILISIIITIIMITQSIILSKLLSDIRFGVLEGALVLLQLLYEVLHLTGVLGVGGPKLGAVLSNKPWKLKLYYRLIKRVSILNIKRYTLLIQHETIIKVRIIPLDILWVGVSDGQVCAQSG